MALFQNAAQKSSKSKTNYLAEIKCGRMTFGAQNMVTPEIEKGLLYAEKSNEDQMIHLCWKNREKNTKLEDWLCFPDDVKIKIITQLPDHRVFFIKFNATNQRHFYWFQDASGDNDKENIKRLDMALNNLTELEKIKKEERKKNGNSSSSDNATANFLGGLPKEYQQMLSEDPATAGYIGQLLGQLEGKMGSDSKTSVEDSDVASSTANDNASTPAPAKKEKKSVKISDLEAAMKAAASGSAIPKADRYDLVKTLNPKGLAEIIGKKEVQEKLLPHLPDSEKIPKTAEELKKSIGSPQYQQAVSAFQEALESRQLSQVLVQFNLPADAIKAAETGDSKKFAEALEKDCQDEKNDSKAVVDAAEKSENSSESKKASDEEEKMAIDD